MNIDWQCGIDGIIPSTQNSYKNNECNIKIKKEEGENLKIFKKNFLETISSSIQKNSQLPTKEEVFIYVQQFYNSKKEYENRDIDNMAKTILDLLKNNIFEDDNKVRTLLVSKKIDKRIPQNFAYCGLKILKDNNDTIILKQSGIERVITFYNELKKH